VVRSLPYHEDAAMTADAVRVVYDNMPYLVIRNEDGSLARAHGPFTPGTEPNLEECSSDNEVRSARLLASLEDLLPISPPLPPSEDTLAGS
jgi:hypothetical protein